MSDEVLLVVGHVAVVTLNRPTTRNALNLAALAGLADAWERIERGAWKARRHPHRRRWPLLLRQRPQRHAR